MQNDNQQQQQFTSEDTKTQIDRMANEGEAQEQDLDHPSLNPEEQEAKEGDNFRDDRNPDPNQQRPIEVDPNKPNP